MEIIVGRKEQPQHLDKSSVSGRYSVPYRLVCNHESVSPKEFLDVCLPASMIREMMRMVQKYYLVRDFIFQLWQGEEVTVNASQRTSLVIARALVSIPGCDLHARVRDIYTNHIEPASSQLKAHIPGPAFHVENSYFVGRLYL